MERKCSHDDVANYRVRIELAINQYQKKPKYISGICNTYVYIFSVSSHLRFTDHSELLLERSSLFLLLFSSPYLLAFLCSGELLSQHTALAFAAGKIVG